MCRKVCAQFSYEIYVRPKSYSRTVEFNFAKICNRILTQSIGAWPRARDCCLRSRDRSTWDKTFECRILRRCGQFRNDDRSNRLAIVYLRLFFSNSISIFQHSKFINRQPFVKRSNSITLMNWKPVKQRLDNGTALHNPNRLTSWN